MNQLLKQTIISTVVLMSACGEATVSEDSANDYTSLACVHDEQKDSSQAVGGRINSAAYANTYHELATGRQDSNNQAVSIDYMVHVPSATTPRAIVILIAGGQLNANLSGVDGQSVDTASGNFLVRSAHLFAEQGYKVITIDRPSDWQSHLDNLANPTAGRALDPYRISAAHETDLRAILTQENGTNLPVVIAGTSRGAISAVAQQGLADYVMLSAPVTSGNGHPVGSGLALPATVNKPVHMIWHEGDACFVSTPQGAQGIIGDFADVTAVQVSGGYDNPDPLDTSNPACDGSRTYHGFLGIESCVVKNATDWLDAQLN